jgi:hypothetical protein
LERASRDRRPGGRFGPRWLRLSLRLWFRLRLRWRLRLWFGWSSSLLFVLLGFR